LDEIRKYFGSACGEKRIVQLVISLIELYMNY
jgi:hypothetical protein